MRRIFYIILLLVVILFSVNGQSNDAVNTIFHSSNFSALDTYMADEVDLCILNDQVFTTRSKSIDKLVVFFKSNQILSVERLHEGSSRMRSSSYSVSKITTKGGKKFRLVTYFRSKSGKQLISEIRIENLDE
jgi:hypothetical protein